MGNQRVGSHFSTAAANPHVRRQQQCGSKGTQGLRRKGPGELADLLTFSTSWAGAITVALDLLRFGALFSPTGLVGIILEMARPPKFPLLFGSRPTLRLP